MLPPVVALLVAAPLLPPCEGSAAVRRTYLSDVGQLTRTATPPHASPLAPPAPPARRPRRGSDCARPPRRRWQTHRYPWAAPVFLIVLAAALPPFPVVCGVGGRRKTPPPHLQMFPLSLTVRFDEFAMLGLQPLRCVTSEDRHAGDPHRNGEQCHPSFIRLVLYGLVGWVAVPTRSRLNRLTRSVSPDADPQSHSRGPLRRTPTRHADRSPRPALHNESGRSVFNIGRWNVKARLPLVATQRRSRAKLGQ